MISRSQATLIRGANGPSGADVLGPDWMRALAGNRVVRAALPKNANGYPILWETIAFA